MLLILAIQLQSKDHSVTGKNSGIEQTAPGWRKERHFQDLPLGSLAHNKGTKRQGRVCFIMAAYFILENESGAGEQTGIGSPGVVDKGKSTENISSKRVLTHTNTRWYCDLPAQEQSRMAPVPYRLVGHGGRDIA